MRRRITRRPRRSWRAKRSRGKSRPVYVKASRGGIRL